MKKITMKIGDTVAIIDHGELKKGVLKDIKILDRPIAIVDFNGDIRKVLVEDLAKIDEDIQEIKKPVEKSEITITSDEFREVCATIIGEEIEKLGPDDNRLIGFLFTFFSAKLHNVLFIDKAE